MLASPLYLLFFFFNDTATTEIYTLSLHDALPICAAAVSRHPNTGRSYVAPHSCLLRPARRLVRARGCGVDRKSTRLNSSHLVISYAVFCLKKKKENYKTYRRCLDQHWCTCGAHVH